MFFSFGKTASAENEVVFSRDPWHPVGWTDPNPSEYERQRLECVSKGVTWHSCYGDASKTDHAYGDPSSSNPGPSTSTQTP